MVAGVGHARPAGPTWWPARPILKRKEGQSGPTVVATGEWLGPWGKLQSSLAVEELAGMLALHQAIPLAGRQLDPVTFRRWKAGLVAEIARLCRLMHDRGHYHKDLYLCHFFIARQDTARIPDWTGRAHMIDFQL